jgi:hypothetical protein
MFSEAPGGKDPERPVVEMLYAERSPTGFGMSAMGSANGFAPIWGFHGYSTIGTNLYAMIMAQRFWSRDLTVKECLSFGALIVTESSKTDVGIGGLPRLWVLSETGPTSVPDEDVKKIVDSNDRYTRSYWSGFREMVRSG